MKYATVAAVVFGVVLVYCLASEDKRLAKRVIGATALCQDGMITTAERGKQGVCAGHGGVKKWLD